MEKDLEKILADNFDSLRKNPYPGRGIIAGLDESGMFLGLGYWIMGRSPNSRNRIFIEEEGKLKTQAADPDKVEDPSLIIYTAMANRHASVFAVSNGHQTEDAATLAYNQESMLAHPKFPGQWQYEPDKPNYTPRITAVLSIDEGKPFLQMSILKKSVYGDGCDHMLYTYNNFIPGVGYCITTYSGDGEPLPSFVGEPYLLPLKGLHPEVLETYWEALNEDNKVSLAFQFIDIEKGFHEIMIENKYEAVSL